MNITCILLPHYNSPEGLYNTVASIGKNEKVDLCIVDDGSSLKFDENLVKGKFEAKGEVYFLYQSQNKGITVALNTGLQFIINRKYKYIARLDCSDLCHPERFKQQESFLNKSEEISLIGCNCVAIDENSKELYKIRLPSFDAEIRKKMYINSMLIHPAIMFRSKIIEDVGFYREVPAAEDYDFFFRVLAVTKTANLVDFLMYIQIDNNGISATKRKKQLISRIKVILDNFELGLYPIYGLLRNSLLLFIPRNLLLVIKRYLFKR